MPSLQPGHIVIFDNLSAHKGPVIRILIEYAGCQLLFLPADSPDFTPSEPVCSKLKTALCRAQARTQPA